MSEEAQDRDHHDHKIEDVPAGLDVRLWRGDERVGDDLNRHLEDEEAGEPIVEHVEQRLELRVGLKAWHVECQADGRRDDKQDDERVKPARLRDVAAQQPEAAVGREAAA